MQLRKMILVCTYDNYSQRDMGETVLYALNYNKCPEQRGMYVMIYIYIYIYMYHSNKALSQISQYLPAPFSPTYICT